MSEASFQGAVLEYAGLMGWLSYHTRDSRGSNPGFPDLVLVRDNHLMFIELKTDTGKVSPQQRVWLGALSAAGQEVHVWRPSDWPAILDTLKRGHLSGAAPRSDVDLNKIDPINPADCSPRRAA
jgi:hypothetical protein